MNLTWLKQRNAWQPLTFGGVASFASASLKRLLLVQFIFALFAAAAVVWFLENSWFPTIRQAIVALPEKGEIVAGKLDWSEETPRALVEGRFLSFTVDMKHTGVVRVPAHIQVELGRTSFRCYSLFGYADFPYDTGGWIMAANRAELLPWWGAWAPPILWIAFGVVTFSLMLNWSVLASLYFLPVWLVGFFLNRKLSTWSSWKLSGAALMPGALLMTLAILLYGFGVLDLVQLFAATVAHFVLGWVYCFVTPWFQPKLPVLTTASNPFTKSNPFIARDSSPKDPSESPDSLDK